MLFMFSSHAVVLFFLRGQVVLQLDDTITQRLSHGPLLSGNNFPVPHGPARDFILFPGEPLSVDQILPLLIPVLLGKIQAVPEGGKLLCGGISLFVQLDDLVAELAYVFVQGQILFRQLLDCLLGLG